MKTLRDICEVYSGYALKEFNELYDGLPVIKIGNIMTDGTLALEKCQYTSEVVNEKYYSKKGDIYVALSGATTGKIGILESDERYVINQRVGVVRRKDDEVPQNFVKYFLMRQTNRILQEASGCAQPNISPKQIAQYEVPKLSKTEMNEISTILDRLSNVLAQRKLELQKLDNLIKARFVEMFGDPNINNMNWNMSVISDIGRCVAGATPSTAKPEYWDNGTIPWLSSGEVNKGRIYETDTKITQQGYDNASTKMVPAKTVVLAMAGQGKTRGTAAITEIELCTNQSICSIVNNERVNHEYLLAFLKMQYKELRKASTSAEGRGGLNLKIIGAYPIMIPPIELQNQFATFVAQVDKSKVAIQKALDEANVLFDSLMQQFFG